ncbi:hypothetical protein BU17DRAFT_64366 [Hysterangium stoloniferum]|nr:hypothetical protein BU17DRAFT_64366 [Hysterangium stoloniferum]
MWEFVGRFLASTAPNDQFDPSSAICSAKIIFVAVHSSSVYGAVLFVFQMYLKQLGTSYFVWPGASHNRFEHCLGVFHLASMMVRRLQKAQPSLDITDRDIKCIETAALCHDLGHGPYSHVWDGTFIPTVLPGSKWKHEDASEMMLDSLVEDNNVDIKPDEVRFVKDIISGVKKHTLLHSPPEKDFLFEIVANKRNGIDVDRLINSARVIEGEICYSEKNANTVYGLFQERFNLHKTLYQHKTAKSIEYMIVDTLVKADPYLKIAARIHNPKKFVHLTDEILLEVERSECPELAASREIIHRIRTRDLYKLVDKTFLAWESRNKWRSQYTPECIVETAKTLRGPEIDEPGVEQLIKELKKDHIVVDVTELHHGMGDKYPLENCKFYGKYSPGIHAQRGIIEAFPPRREADISYLLPREFGEVLIRVFTRDSKFFGVIQLAARSLHERLSSDIPSISLVPERSATPEAHPTTSLGLTNSLSSVLSEPKTPGRSESISSIGAQVSPSSHNNFFTVPAGFTPKAPRIKGNTRSGKKERDEDPVSFDMSRSRKRDKADKAGNSENASVEGTARKRRRA